MSSDDSTQTDEKVAARCLLCNVACPVRVTGAGPDRWMPDYVPYAGYAGLCGRGSALVELLDHPERILTVVRPAQGTAGPPTVAEAAGRLAESLRGGQSAAIIADGNLDVDTLAAVGRLASEVGARWSVFVASGDAGLVHSLDSGGCTFIGPEGLADADAVLALGDIYATHPVVSHWLFKAKEASRRMPFLVVADASSATAKFATSLYQPALRAGEAARVVDAVRTGNADGLAPEARVLARWAEQLRAAKKAAIVVGAEMGYAEARLLGAAVAALAADLGASVCPLTAYGGAWGALRAASSGGAVCPIMSLSQPMDVLLVIGVDLESALGRHAVASAMASADEVFYVGPMPNRMTDQASLVVPSAFVFETSGRTLCGPGREVAFGPLMAPPAGVPTVREVLAMAGVTGDVKADVSTPCKAPEAPPVGKGADGEGEGLLVSLAGDAVHFADGSLTRRAAWPQHVRPRPVLMMAASDAEAVRLTDAQRAIIEGPGGSAEVEVATSVALRPGQGRISAAFSEVRDVFGWTQDGRRPGDPVRVSVRKA